MGCLLKSRPVNRELQCKAAPEILGNVEEGIMT